ncbi:MAG: hypothetical protein IKD18_04500, partial [Clostridia bacterium]|nr:hypothetical protein [Clostridia bacterium]
MNFHLMPAVKNLHVTDEHIKIRASDLYLSEDIKRYVKKAEEVISGNGHTEVSLKICADLSREAYRIKVSDEGIRISASAPNGA